jgi:cytochrome bd ubiquinol oxidase subunit I
VYYIVRIVQRGLADGNVLTVWNGHVIERTYALAARPARAPKPNIHTIR